MSLFPFGNRGLVLCYATGFALVDKWVWVGVFVIKFLCDIIVWHYSSMVVCFSCGS